MKPFIISVLSHIIVILATCQMFLFDGYAVAIVSATVADIGAIAALVLFIPFVDEFVDFMGAKRQKGDIFERMHLPTKFLNWVNLYSFGVLETWAEHTEC